VAGADIAAGSYLLANTGLQASPLTLITAGAGDPVMDFHYLDADDFTVTGKNTRLRVRGTVCTNATQPLITFTFGLYPITFAGAADALTATRGAVVTSSTAAVASPAASSAVTVASSDFAVPGDGVYALGVQTSAQLTNNAAALLVANLEVHWT
jgi:hypothetical protein